MDTITSTRPPPHLVNKITPTTRIKTSTVTRGQDRLKVTGFKKGHFKAQNICTGVWRREPWGEKREQPIAATIKWACARENPSLLLFHATGDRRPQWLGEPLLLVGDYWFCCCHFLLSWCVFCEQQDSATVRLKVCMSFSFAAFLTLCCFTSDGGLGGHGF